MFEKWSVLSYIPGGRYFKNIFDLENNLGRDLTLQLLAHNKKILTNDRKLLKEKSSGEKCLKLIKLNTEGMMKFQCL